MKRYIFLISIIFLFTIVQNSFCQTPSDISGLSLWLDAGNNVFSSNDSVYQWKDLSQNNFSANSLSNLQRPFLIHAVSSLNNKPVLRFDGTDDYLFINTPVSIGTVFMVLNWNGGGQVFPDYNSPLSSNQAPNWDVFYAQANDFNINSPYAGFNIFINNSSSTDFRPLEKYKILMASGVPKIFNNLFVALGEGTHTREWNGDIAEIIAYDHQLSLSQKDSIILYIRNKYAPPVNLGPDINIAYGYCNKVLDASSRFTNYLWSTGDTTQTISIKNSGAYWVQVKDVFGYTSRDTINVNYPKPQYPIGSAMLCFGASKTWNTYFLKNAYSFLWQDSTTDSLYTITQAGQYYVTITDTLGCSKTSDTLNITIDNFSTIADLGPPLSLCSGNSIYLTTGATQATNYTWSDTSHNDSLQILKPLGTYTYWVTVSDSNSCSKTDSIDVTVVGLAPIPDFSFNTTCLGNTTQLTDLSSPTDTSAITNWLWDFGDPSSGVLDTSTFKNPQHYYVSSGTYTIRLEIRTNAGCEVAINKLIIIHPKPSVVNLSPTNLCSNSNVHFSPSVTTFGDPITNWNWNFGDASSGINNTSALQNPSHVFVTGGASYPVQLIVQNGYGCRDTIISSIGIKASPIANFNYSLACKDQQILFTDNSTYFSSTLASTIWNFGDGITITAPPNPSHTYASNVTYQVIHVVTDNYNCKDSVIKTVQVYPTPDAYFSIGNSCVNAPTDFTDLSVISSGSITNWKWNYNGIATSNLQNSQYTFNSPGNVNVGLLVTSNMGCKDSLTQSFAIHPIPVADFTFTPQYGNSPLAVTFTNTSSGASSYLWVFGDGSASSTIVNPMHTYIDTGTFSISLTAMDNFGCEQTKVKTIPILKRFIDVAIMAIYDTLQNNYLNTSAQIVNLGTTDITSMEIYITVNNGPAIKENWTGLLHSSNIMTYKSSSSMYLKDATHYVCLTIQNPNQVADENPSNNTLCEALDLSVFQILDMYPNPSNDLITLPLIIPELKNLNISIYDANGKIVKSSYSGNIDKGLQLITINVMELNAGFYGCKIEYGNETFVKKFIKR